MPDRTLSASPGKTNVLKKTCTIEGCDKKYRARGYCNKHYDRWIKGRDLLVEAPTVKWATAHDRASRLWGPAKQYPCVECGKTAAHWAYDGTDPTEILGEARRRPDDDGNMRTSLLLYSEWPEFYMPMCHKCHARKDGAISAKELREYRTWRALTGMTLADCECEPKQRGPQEGRMTTLDTREEHLLRMANHNPPTKRPGFIAQDQSFGKDA